jgi:cytochrome c
MASLTSNKIIGAGLGTALFLVGLTVGLPIIFEKEPPKHPGFIVAVSPELAGGGAAEAADTPPDWGTVLKTADVSAGEAKTAVCKACHIFDAAGTNLIGPGLWGVVGRKPGSHPGFSYSAGMEAFGAKQPIWDYEHIYEFLKGPGAYIDGTKMTYAGMKNPQDRINVIAYLHTLGSTLPIPAPKPAAAAAPGGQGTDAGGGPPPAPGAAAAGQPTSAPAGTPASSDAKTPSGGAGSVGSTPGRPTN